MTRQQQIAVLFSALLLTQANGAEAALVTRDSPQATAQDISTIPFTDTFGQVFEVLALYGISGGTITTAEGGTFTLSAHFTSGNTAPLFSTHVAGSIPFLLNAIPPESIDPASGPVNGLVFSFVFDPFASQTSVMAATVEVTYTFQVQDAPEPLSLSLFGTGLAGLAWARRRR